MTLAPPRLCWTVIRQRDAEGGVPTAADPAAGVSIRAAICGHAKSQYIELTADPAVAAHQALAQHRIHWKELKGRRCEIVQVDLAECPLVRIIDLRSSRASQLAGLRPGQPPPHPFTYPYRRV